jgi:hypothetical protein
MIIPLAPALLPGSCNLPGNIERAALKRSPIRSCSGWGLPCRPRHRGRGELLPRLFTLTPQKLRSGMFSVALSLGSPPVAVSDHPALWSSDFPPAYGERSPDPLPQIKEFHSKERRDFYNLANNQEIQSVRRTAFNEMKDKDFRKWSIPKRLSLGALASGILGPFKLGFFGLSLHWPADRPGDSARGGCAGGDIF